MLGMAGGDSRAPETLFVEGHVPEGLRPGSPAALQRLGQ